MRGESIEEMDVMNAIPHDVIRIIIGAGSSGIAYSMLAGEGRSRKKSGSERESRSTKGKKELYRDKRVVGAASVCIGLASSLTALLLPEDYFYPAVVSLAAFLSVAGDIVLRRKK